MSTATIDYIADLTSEVELVENSPITNYFRGKIIFITGATGCIGQLILEKLLRYPFIFYVCTLKVKVLFYLHAWRKKKQENIRLNN